MISERQKNIYNSFLRASRITKNQPYKQRQNFDKLDSTKEVLLKKLDHFFSSHTTVNYNDFFIAPYRIYDKDGLANEYFDLQFYVTRKALKCYTEFVKQREVEEPDSEDIVNGCKECCAFIYRYCNENKITLAEYKTNTSDAIPLAIQHLKEHKINFYTMHGLEISNLVRGEDAMIYNFIFENFYNVYNNTRSKFIRSKRLKEVVRTALKMIEQKLLIFQKTNIQ
jgi:hypothetical protein